MTPEQQFAIKQLRQDGLGYKAISHKLSISVNTIKSFCRREGLISQKTNSAKISCDYCPVCSKPLTHIFGKKKKKYCSDTCRLKWWNTHQEKVNRKAYSEYTCVGCQQFFTSYGKQKRKYCSHQCYITNRFGGSQDEKVVSE
ncbi:RNA polymerase subunit sigma-70 [Streptococcus himalayensis]|uniref:RNA polymerase subunit sigma-70 n=1 Tax=Streptococcus himalayensis TaxID=1888195 RepID=UPI00083DC5F3|nr:RNA polymerase subunit sigma-70 [Streptococcus himalayensis]QBX16519.1 zinc-finger protein [Streptococcus phage Javan255]